MLQPEVARARWRSERGRAAVGALAAVLLVVMWPRAGGASETDGDGGSPSIRTSPTSTISCCCNAAATVSPATAAGTAAADPVALGLARVQVAEAAGDLAGAARIYRQIVADHPDDALGWAAYGEFLRFLIHDPVQAKQAFTTALQVPHPSARLRALALKGLGDIAGATGEREQAIALMRQSLAVMPLADTHRALSVLLLIAHHDASGAAEEARLAVADSPDDPLSLLVYAILCQRIGHQDEGRRAYRLALGIAGCDAQGHADHPVHCCVFYNAACYLAVCRQPSQALTMLSAFFAAPNHLHRSRKDIVGDPDFAGMLQDPGFQALLDRNLPVAVTVAVSTASALPASSSSTPVRR